jgi:23S rRNA pseudouridine2605 synthase
MINKPRDCICTRHDPQKRRTIYDLFPQDYFKNFGHLMTVGRLDYNSEGLLLVTNDSMLKEFLENPNNEFPRRYEVKVHGRVTPAKMEKMNSPIMIKDIQYGPLKAKIMR